MAKRNQREDRSQNSIECDDFVTQQQLNSNSRENDRLIDIEQPHLPFAFMPPNVRRRDNPSKSSVLVVDRTTH
jgi:hypothetical protein